MESLAFIHMAVGYEDPNPAPELTAFDDLKLPNSVLLGVAGAAVAASVLGVSPSQATAAPAPVGPGSSGEHVQAVQKALGIEADGKYGAKTEAAIMDFQIRQGLKEIDGVVGKETATALGLDEQYRPIGYVDTRYDVGLNIRSYPGLSAAVIGGASEGAYLYQQFEDVAYVDGYYWTPLETGGWVADYDDDLGYSLVSHTYYEGDNYDDYYEEDVSYDPYYDGYYRNVSYSPYPGVYYYPVSYDGCSCGCD